MTQDAVTSRPSRGRNWLSLLLGVAAVAAVYLVARGYTGAVPAQAQMQAPPPWQGRATAPAAQQATNGTAARNNAGGAARPSQMAAPREGVRATSFTTAAPQQNKQGQANKDAKAQSAPEIVAVVNRTEITRDELAKECLRHYGSEVLESLINKFLIVEECRRRGITVTREEVDAEVDRMAQRFRLPTEQWLAMLKQERGINPIQYAADIVWPTLALRKLAGDRLQVTAEEKRRAYETYYGSTIRCRLIACKTRAEAESIRADAAKAPEQFGDLAKKYSIDPSASAKGLIQPIRHHGTYPELEKAAFTMKDGEISPVIGVADQFVLIKREAEIPGPSTVQYDRVAAQLEELIRERKMRSVAAEIFQQLQKDAKVVNVINDPAKRAQMPGVAAMINNRPIPLDDLANECLARHGDQVLTGVINRKILEQACKQRNVAVTPQDMNDEIARAAESALPLKDGKPDIEGWLKMATTDQNVSMENYRNDAVWPSVALRKLAEGDVKISDEDLRRGFESNFGPRARCRAIVLTQPRQAQEVWELARKNLTVENFGSLAEKYSVEPGSQALRGEVPPIRKWGGQPKLEEVAFGLKPGDLSEIVQVGDKYVILFCEGFTEPAAGVTLNQTREEIRRDLYEKKLNLVMADYFDHLVESATIDNFLAGTSQSPKKDKADDKGLVKVPTLRPVSGEEARAPQILLPRPTATR